MEYKDKKQDERYMLSLIFPQNVQSSSLVVMLWGV